MKLKQQMSTKAAVSSATLPLSDCEVTDPRTRRTRSLLHGALRTLMEQRGFEEISVQDIADQATVNRATFYDHYTDKYALLEASVGGGFHALLADRRVEYDGTCASSAAALILATCEFLERTHANESECRRQNAFEPLVDAAVIAAIRRVLKEGIADDLRAAAAAWAIYGAAKEWYRSPTRLAPEKIVPQIQALILPILR